MRLLEDAADAVFVPCKLRLSAEAARHFPLAHVELVASDEAGFVFLLLVSVDKVPF